jgi:hypothetical protein
MKMSSVLFREAWLELQAGFRSGVVVLTFVGLVGYLLMVLTNSGYLQQMGAVEVPRNAANLVYLMSSGDTFFLFFAWAWVFAQPIVRDRQALLHEIVLTAPVSLSVLLAGRFLGALAVALLLGMSQTVGFLLSPLLESAGLVPAGAIGPTPWVPLGWSLLVFVLPSAAGIGALYFLLALRTRSAAGPFAGSAVLIAIWMFSMIVLSEGGILTELAAVLDPSAFGEVDRLNKLWTPAEKATILYPLTTPLLLNRFVWGLLPLLALCIVLPRIRREWLVQEQPRALHRRKLDKAPTPSSSPARKLSVSPLHGLGWLSALWGELCWQHALVLKGRAFQWLLLGTLVMTIAAGFVHGLNHVDGPFEARPEFTLPLLNQTMFLVIAFIAAALVGHVLRRDQRNGFDELLDAAPAPSWVTLLGRLSVVGTLTFCLLLIPGLAAIALAALAAPQSLSIITPLLYQVAIYGPALMELVVVNVLLHCLLRRSGLAYSVSMLATFIMIVNHEAELITFPPFEFGIPAHIEYSVLTGWTEWTQRLLFGDLYKLGFVLALLALAALVQVRGLDSRLRHGGRVIRERLLGVTGLAFGAALAFSAVLYTVLARGFVEGGYQTRGHQLAEQAAWEQRWLPEAGPWSVAGGALDIRIDTQRRLVSGHWRLDEVSTETGVLHFELPEWLTLDTVVVNGATAVFEQQERHALVRLESCTSLDCTVTLDYRIAPRGWHAEGGQHWMQAQGMWARASNLAPTLGIDLHKRLLAPRERTLHGLPITFPPLAAGTTQAASGIAPAGRWELAVSIDGNDHVTRTVTGVLDFAVVDAPRGVALRTDDLLVVADTTRTEQARFVTEDTRLMQSCVARRLGTALPLASVVQLPRGLAGTLMAADTLLLEEAPHWDVGADKTGRWLRQATIASALAKATLAQAGNLRQGEGTQALLEGVSGAIGALCVGDVNGTSALQRLLTRAAERISQTMAAAEAPIETLGVASPESWIGEYSAAAQLAWVAQSPPARFERLLVSLRATGAVPAALQTELGTELAATVLGRPLASDVSVPADSKSSNTSRAIEVQRFEWQQGGWQSAAVTADLLALQRGDPALQVSVLPVDLAPSSILDAMLLLDAWPAFERTPVDNASE